MLDYAGYLGIREVKLAGLQRAQNWFEVLIYLFASHLKDEWHQGAYFNYQSINAVLPTLKGKWQIATQLKRPEQQHQFAVTYDEFTADNPLNHVFRYVVEGLWQLTGDSGNRQRLAQLRDLMDEEVKLLPTVTADMAKKIQLTRLNKHYKPLLNLAQLFLERLSLKLTASDMTTFSFVFDMNQLFERFIVGFIQRHHSEILPMSLESCELLPQGTQTSKYLACYNGQEIFRLKPDLVFKNNEHFPVIMDIKYKHLDEGDEKLGIAQPDFYQMYAYANRYNCPRLILIYPQTSNLLSPKRAYCEIEKTKQKIWAVTVNLLKNLSEPEARQTLKAELKEILEKVSE
jgi:5-methylcytosine-specific restriction enzyme subunit McrC